MRLLHLQALCLLACHLASSAHVRAAGAGAITHAHRRSRRSGGFPKFPARPECGTRSVPYNPSHSEGVMQAKIVGGTTVPYGAFPWQVDIKLYRSLTGRYEHHCGGALVGDKLVLTAAHCLNDVVVDQLRVTTGEHRLNANDRHEQNHRVERILVHPDFRRAGPYSNDIALLKVAPVNNRGVPFNAHVRPICLPEVTTKSSVGSWCTVTGWGAQTPDDLGSISPVLQAAAVPLLDLATCRQNDIFGGRRQSILDSMVCAGLLEGGVDACGGDSGGPLACEVNGKFVLTGVVSWGDGCAKRNRPGVYTRVSHFSPWIQSAIAKLGQ